MTSLIRFSPEIRRMQREIDRLFDDFIPSRSENESEGPVWSPRVDMAETEEAFTIHVDAPGMSKDDFNINLQNGTLAISGERKWSQDTNKENYVRVERSYGHFVRSFSLPTQVNVEGVTATYENGVLTLRVPKAEESKARKIEIK